MTVLERQHMAELAYQCFHRRYDMRENAKRLLSVSLEQLLFNAGLLIQNRFSRIMPKQIHYNAAEHIAPTQRLIHTCVQHLCLMTVCVG